MSHQPKKNPSAQTKTHKRDDAASREESNRRDSVVDRRSGIDRREMSKVNGKKRNVSSNLERRRGPGRRRTDYMKAADEGELTQEQFLFVMAIDAFKQANDKTFPSWTDVLEVIRKLGYRKTMPTSINLGNRAEDWVERADAPDGVSKVTPSPDECEESSND